MTNLCSLGAGRHPCYIGERLDGSNGSQDLRLHLDDRRTHGFVHRSESGCLRLIRGVLERPADADRPPYACPLEWFTSCDGGEASEGDVISDAVSGRDLLNGSSPVRGGTTFGTRESYHWWARNERHYHAGKPLFVEAPVKEGGTYSVLFDDHNRPDTDDAICHVMDRDTGEAIPADQRQNHLVHVKPLEVIQDPGYFVHALAEAEAQRWQPRGN